MTTGFSRLAAVSLIALLALCLAWELWLAPLRPGGSMLVLKACRSCCRCAASCTADAIPINGHRCWCCFYLSPRAWYAALSDHGASQLLAMAETVLATLLFAGCLGHARTAPSRTIKAGD
jgi:uncharacterized membrane protein